MLLVEGQPLLRNMLNLMIKSMECEVDIASDENEALEKATTVPYDLILVDVGQPE